MASRPKRRVVGSAVPRGEEEEGKVQDEHEDDEDSDEDEDEDEDDESVDEVRDVRDLGLLYIWENTFPATRALGRCALPGKGPPKGRGR